LIRLGRDAYRTDLRCQARIASIGLTRAARIAGRKPLTTPMKPARRMARTRIAGVGSNEKTISDHVPALSIVIFTNLRASAAIAPTLPPRTASTIDSSKNDVRMLAREKPSARSVPSPGPRACCWRDVPSPAVVYERRRPEATTLYQVVADSLATLYGAVDEGALGIALPRFVKKELEGYLDCGLLCRGFARLRCDGCEETRLVAFSCKGRGFCPSCLGRKMSATAAHLIEDVLPVGVPLRQWVLTVPFAWRRRLGYDGPLLSALTRLFVKTVLDFYGERGGDSARGQSGGVVAVQRTSSDLKLKSARARGVSRRRVSGERGGERRAGVRRAGAPVDARRGGRARTDARPDDEVPSSSRSSRGRRRGGGGERARRSVAPRCVGHLGGDAACGARVASWRAASAASGDGIRASGA
jgi:hypothetical protein